MTDYADIVKRLRANLDKYPGFVNLNADAATAMETLLAQRAVLVEEVEAARMFREKLRESYVDPRYIAVWSLYASHGGNYEGPTWTTEQMKYDAARAATDAAFPEGLTK